MCTCCIREIRDSYGRLGNLVYLDEFAGRNTCACFYFCTVNVYMESCLSITVYDNNYFQLLDGDHHRKEGVLG